MFYKIFIKLLSSAEINSTMLNNDVKFTKKNYDAIIKYCTVQTLTQKLIFHTNKQLKFTKLH